MSIPGRNVGSGKDAARTSMPMPRAKAASFSAIGFDNMASRRMALRRFGQRVLGPGEGPIEPLGQNLDVGGLDAGATPDAQSGRCIAIVRDVVAGALLLDRGGKRFRECRLGVRRKRGYGRIDDLEADRRSEER